MKHVLTLLISVVYSTHFFAQESGCSQMLNQVQHDKTAQRENINF